MCRAFGPIPLSESQLIWLCSVWQWYSWVCYLLIRSNHFVMPIQLWHHPHLEVQPFFDIPFLESKSGQTIWPSTSKSPWALATSLKVKQFDFSPFKVLATRCDWGHQFDQLPLWHVEPLALSLYLKVKQFDFVLWDTGTHMYVTYWLGPTDLQCHPVVTPSTPEANHVWHTLLRVQEWSNNLTIPFNFEEPLTLAALLCWKSNNLTFSL